MIEFRASYLKSGLSELKAVLNWQTVMWYLLHCLQDGQKFRKFSVDVQRIFNGAPNCEFRLIMTFAFLSLRTETYTEVCGEFSKISLKNTRFIRI